VRRAVEVGGGEEGAPVGLAVGKALAGGHVHECPHLRRRHGRAHVHAHATHPVRAGDEDEDVGQAEYEQVAAGRVTVRKNGMEGGGGDLKQCVSQPLLTGPHASFGLPQKESIKRSGAMRE
jgi:hypothetical protein